MKVIFLDIDGVLITAETCRLGLFAVDERCVRLLNQLTQATGAKIVVSSCWRIGRSVQELKELLNGRWCVTGEVIDRTDNLEAVRGHEIGKWLLEHPDVEAFVILDDDGDMAGLKGHLVQTDFMSGLTAKHVTAAEAQLAKPAKAKGESA